MWRKISEERLLFILLKGVSLFHIMIRNTIRSFKMWKIHNVPQSCYSGNCSSGSRDPTFPLQICMHILKYPVSGMLWRKCSFIIHSRALNQSVIVERVTCWSNILRYWTVANRGFFHGFSTIFRCFVNFKHTTSDMAE
jgi:hypothetical protein